MKSTGQSHHEDDKPVEKNRKNKTNNNHLTFI